jgi:tRNA (cmo5U34)-methyltransferase
MDQSMDREPGWNEDDSQRFIDLGRFFVPDREEQIAAFLDVVPDPGDGLLVDLCCGEGLVSQALLERFPRARVLGLDLSPTMLEQARANAGPHGGRFTGGLFDLADHAWRSFAEPVHAFVSSLAVHHLEGAAKRELFRDLAAALAPGGAVVIADLIEPASPRSRALAARVWDESVRQRALAIAGDLAPYEEFVRSRWNLYAESEPDPIDHPSPLFDQLRWLAEAGLAGVDVFWLKAGHALYGGFRPDATLP